MTFFATNDKIQIAIPRGVTRIRRRDLSKDREKNQSIDLQLLEVEEQIRNLEEEKKKIQRSKEESNRKLTIDGLQYYTQEKRDTLLEKAEKLCYSKTSIDSFRSIRNDDWNMDNIVSSQIEELMAIEDYVKKDTPFWQKSIVAKIGGTILDRSGDANED